MQLWVLGDRAPPPGPPTAVGGLIGLHGFNGHLEGEALKGSSGRDTLVYKCLISAPALPSPTPDAASQGGKAPFLARQLPLVGLYRKCLLALD